MAQHFLLSPAAKTLSLAKVLRMSDEQAAEAFRAIRWHETDGKPVCPECGGMDHYDLKSRPGWKCKDCAKQFSMTSGTVFHSRKLKLRDILGAIAIFTNGAKGYSALQLSRDLGCDYKTCFVLLHKVRESLGLARDAGALQGDVELDGAYFGGHVRPENRKEDRKDRRGDRRDRRRHPPACQGEGGRSIPGTVAGPGQGSWGRAIGNIPQPVFQSPGNGFAGRFGRHLHHSLLSRGAGCIGNPGLCHGCWEGHHLHSLLAC